MKIMMSTKDLGKASVIKGAIDGVYTAAQAAGKLGVSPRWVKQLKRRVREQGDFALIHGNSNRHPANCTDELIKAKIIGLKKSTKYKLANFTHFKELLEEHENINISYSCLSDILKGAGIVSPKTHRMSGERHDMRPRRPKFGELVQTDASPFDWFGTGVSSALHGFQDDATGDILGLYFCENECLQGYFEAFRPVLTNFGAPQALYADRIGVYFVNTKHPENWTIEEQLAGKTLDKTQFGIIAEKLGSDIIPAGSPQAKGRIESLWQTLQSRLTQYFVMHDIKDIASANAILPKFSNEFNKKFHREPENKIETGFAPIPKDYDLDTLLTAKYERKTDACSCFSFQNYTFQIDSKRPIIKKKIVFMFSEKLGFKAYYNKTYYDVKFLDFLNKDKKSHLPQVTKRLIHDCYFASVKIPELQVGG
jgi:transposase